jgi:flagellar hook-associated protein FlgK
MAISSVINTGIQGMQKSQSSMLNSAQQIASAGTIQASTGASPVSGEALTTSQSIVEPILNLTQEQQVFDASAKVVQTGSDILGSLLDIKA